MICKYTFIKKSGKKNYKTELNYQGIFRGALRLPPPFGEEKMY